MTLLFKSFNAPESTAWIASVEASGIAVDQVIEAYESDESRALVYQYGPCKIPCLLWVGDTGKVERNPFDDSDLTTFAVAVAAVIAAAGQD